MSRLLSLLPPSTTAIVAPSAPGSARRLSNKAPIWVSSLRQGITISSRRVIGAG